MLQVIPCRAMKLSHFAVKKNGTVTLGKSLIMLITHIWYDTAIPVQDWYSKFMLALLHICTKVSETFITVLFIKVPNWKWLKFPSTVAWKNKVLYIKEILSTNGAECKTAIYNINVCLKHMFEKKECRRICKEQVHLCKANISHKQMLLFAANV